MAHFTLGALDDSYLDPANKVNYELLGILFLAVIPFLIRINEPYTPHFTKIHKWETEITAKDILKCFPFLNLELYTIYYTLDFN